MPDPAARRQQPWLDIPDPHMVYIVLGSIAAQYMRVQISSLALYIPHVVKNSLFTSDSVLFLSLNFQVPTSDGKLEYHGQDSNCVN
ncbi:unnamed protein product [Ambrosiozyma monospora]|uniref:Unnamed protein product n=1 Tax=Ambrosiozyma monospora TaxID=43982 RepID=A0A9W7DJ29_AMBMO|nr:unnamed protein product [Ambrosiozyma monospora]